MKPEKKLTDPDKTPSRPWIKICGLTRVENAVACATLGADAIGLVFFKKSPRHVSNQAARDICKALPESTDKIGVFVNETYERIMEKVDDCGLTGVQLHGHEPPDLVHWLRAYNLIVIKALFAAREPFLDQAQAYDGASYLLVEYGKGVLPGGNAESWDYGLANRLNTRTPVILAGGLTCENVTRAVKKTCPAGVDISSGVERSHGIKEISKVRDFIRAVLS